MKDRADGFVEFPCANGVRRDEVMRTAEGRVLDEMGYCLEEVVEVNPRNPVLSIAWVTAEAPAEEGSDSIEYSAISEYDAHSDCRDAETVIAGWGGFVLPILAYACEETGTTGRVLVDNGVTVGAVVSRGGSLDEDFGGGFGCADGGHE